MYSSPDTLHLKLFKTPTVLLRNVAVLYSSNILIHFSNVERILLFSLIEKGKKRTLSWFNSSPDTLLCLPIFLLFPSASPLVFCFLPVLSSILFDQMPCCYAASRQCDVSGPSSRHHCFTTRLRQRGDFVLLAPLVTSWNLEFELKCTSLLSLQGAHLLSYTR